MLAFWALVPRTCKCIVCIIEVCALTTQWSRGVCKMNTQTLNKIIPAGLCTVLYGVWEKVGWWDVPKQCVLVRIFWDPCSPKLTVLETRCPWIDASLLLCILKYENVMHNGRDVSLQGNRVSRTINIVDQGSRKIPSGTHRSGTSHHPTWEDWDRGRGLGGCTGPDLPELGHISWHILYRRKSYFHELHAIKHLK